MGCGASKDEKKKDESKQRSAEDTKETYKEEPTKDDPPPAAAAAPPPATATPDAPAAARPLTPLAPEGVDPDADPSYYAPPEMLAAVTEVNTANEGEMVMVNEENLDTPEAAVAYIKGEACDAGPKVIFTGCSNWSTAVVKALVSEFASTLEGFTYQNPDESGSFDDEAITALVDGFPKLRNLHLTSFPDGAMTDAKVALLEPAMPRLMQLALRGNNAVTDACIKSFASAAEMRLIDVAETGITPDGFVTLCGSMPRLLYFNGPEGLTPEHMEKIFAACPRLMDFEVPEETEPLVPEALKEKLPRYFDRASQSVAHLFPELHEDDEEYEEGEEEEGSEEEG